MSSQTLKERYLAAKRRLFNKYYSNLNPEQREAVFTTEGSLLVLAGAGSGKTTVLVNRVGFILKYGNAYFSDYVPADIDEATVQIIESAESFDREDIEKILPMFTSATPNPWNVLAITFTKKAAEEIRQRLASTLGESVNAADIQAGTFHSICVRIIRKYSDRLGFKSDFSIYDTDNTKSVVKEVMKELDIDEKSLAVKSVMGEMSMEKNKLLSPEEYLIGVKGDFRRERIAKIYAQYQKRLVAANALDFDDIIMKTVELLENDSEARGIYQRKFKYICVDEFQDTNEAQLRLTELLCAEHGNVMAVGDDDQSIYKFRGAVIGNILGFDKKFAGTKVIRLERNYRSTQCILDAANAIIANNKGRLGKELYTERKTSSKITLSRCENQKTEAIYISDRITDLVTSGKYKYKDIAVLYRVNAISSSIETTLSSSGIPHKTLSGQSFFDRREIKDVLYYLAFIVNPYDREKFKRIIKVPKRQIGDKSIEALLAIAVEQSMTPLEVMREADKYPALSRASARFIEFAALIDKLASYLDSDISLEDYVRNLLDLTGYKQMWVEAGVEEKERLDNLEELISNVTDFENEYLEAADNYDPSYYDPDSEPPKKTAGAVLSAFIERCALVADVDKYDEDADAVVLMTIHSAKGLEFPVVFLPAMEDGIFPGMQNINSVDASDMEEERRLAYVAVTRAKDEIYVTHTRTRMLYNQTSYFPVSRFVGEIPESLIDNKTEELDRFAYVPQKTVKTYFSDRNTGFSQSVGSPSPATKPKQMPRGDLTLREGDRVRHKMFGDGEILSAKPMGNDVLYEVIFDNVGTKKLMGNFAKLVKI